MEPEIKKYRDLLPDRIAVRVENEGGGYWAKISSPNGELNNCYTQAETIGDLIVMINDAVQTHYDIPEKIRERVGFYVPVSDNHLKWETVFNHVGSMQQDNTRETMLTLQESVLSRR